MSDLSDLALRKIGRNVVNLSKIEGMMKLFLSRVNFQCPFHELKETLEVKKKKYETMTLGMIGKEYFKTYNSDVEPIHEFPEDSKEAWISISFDTQTDGFEGLKKGFDFLVEERNKLIHEMLIDFNPDSTESCEVLIIKLENQNEMIQVEYKNLQDKLRQLDEGIKLYILNQLKDMDEFSDMTINEFLNADKKDYN